MNYKFHHHKDGHITVEASEQSVPHDLIEMARLQKLAQLQAQSAPRPLADQMCTQVTSILPGGLLGRYWK